MSEEKKQSNSTMNPMGMMKKMMGKGSSGMETMKDMMGDNFPPMEMCMNMCTQMSESVERVSEMAAYATPELRGLFDSWLEEVTDEALRVITESGSVSAETLAGKLGITTESAVFIISKLAKEGKIETTAHNKKD
ncbi:MAG: hypothetical protein GXO93_09210 [FCB group bacterium]|nr:hypothetical protein [FCB group bacterium]